MSIPVDLKRARWLRKVRPAKLASALKPVLGIKRRAWAGADGTFWVDPASNLGDRLMSGEQYEPLMHEYFVSAIRPEDTVLDIGANEGYFTVVAARRAKNVIAFEPQSRLQEVIRQNVVLNKCDNVEVVPIALGNEVTELDLNLFPDTNTGASSFAQPAKYTLAKERVKVSTLDTFFDERKMDRVEIAKVDIESFEWEFFQGAERCLHEGCVMRYVVELHPRLLEQRDVRVADIKNLVTKAGYDWHQVDDELAVILHPQADRLQ